MKVAVFDTHEYESASLLEAARFGGHEVTFLQPRLTSETVALAQNHHVVCVFVNDQVNEAVLRKLKEMGVHLVALRSAGFNHVDLKAAHELGISVVRVPAYSPYAVAEFATALLLSLNRKIHKAYNRVHELNFSLENLVGFDLHGKVVGVIGTGRIGTAFTRIMLGFGCKVLAYDLQTNPELTSGVGVRYVTLDDLLAQSDIISLHVPLNKNTHQMINTAAFEKMKPGVFLINTGRGGLIDTKALIQVLKKRKIGGAGLDVYEEEEGVFFQDKSVLGIDDDILARLLTFPNVLITSHQAFLTREALKNIAETTFTSVTQFAQKQNLEFAVQL